MHPNCPSARKYLKLTSLALLLAAGAVLPAKAGLIGFQLTLSGNTNAPTITLTNQSGGAQITAFDLTIGNTAKNWDAISTMVNPTGGTATLVSPDVLQDAVRSDVASFTFTGFDTGEFFTVNAIDVDQDIAPQNNVEDFRVVLFNNGALPNSVATVTFSTGETLSYTLQDSPATNTSFTFSTSAVVPDQASTLVLVLGAFSAVALARSRRSRS